MRVPQVKLQAYLLSLQIADASFPIPRHGMGELVSIERVGFGAAVWFDGRSSFVQKTNAYTALRGIRVHKKRGTHQTHRAGDDVALRFAAVERYETVRPERGQSYAAGSLGARPKLATGGVRRGGVDVFPIGAGVVDSHLPRIPKFVR